MYYNLLVVNTIIMKLKLLLSVSISTELYYDTDNKECIKITRLLFVYFYYSLYLVKVTFPVVSTVSIKITL